MTENEIKALIKDKIEVKNAPGLLRLAFHDAGTFCNKTNTGGVSGSITDKKELCRDENDGLQGAASIIHTLKALLPEVSLADIIALSGAVAVNICGGPSIDVGLGRKDKQELSPASRLPDENDNAEKLKSTFQRMGLSIKDLVVLSGAHTIGDAHDKPFTDDRLTFNNSYFKTLLQKDLPSHLNRFKSDESLVDDTELRNLVEKYAENQEAFFDDFKSSYVKMTRMGS